MSLMPQKKCKQEGLAFAAQSSSDQGMAIYEMGWQAEADEVNRARRAAAQRLLEVSRPSRKNASMHKAMRACGVE